MTPSFTIVVPTYRRPKQLASCLAALSALDYPRDKVDVVVVDDGSSKPPHDIVREANGVRIQLVVQKHAGPAAARNAGANHAHGLYVAFTDDDCRPHPGWLRALAKMLSTASDVAVGGRTINSLHDDMYSTASQSLINYLHGYYNMSASGARFFTTTNLAFPLELFRSIGGFDTSFPLAAGEDRDLCDRWREHGYRLLYAEDAVVHHAHSLTLWSFGRQHFNYGRGAFYLHRARSRRGEDRIRLEPMRFYLGLVRHPLSEAHGSRGPLLSLLQVVSQATYGAGYYWERLKHARLKTAAEDSPSISRHSVRSSRESEIGTG